jgi:hypothetical protein
VIAVEMSVAYFLGASLHLRAARGVHIPAINVEHVIERTLQFAVIFFGEAVIASIYRAYDGQYGPQRWVLVTVHGRRIELICWHFSSEYGRSALSVMILFGLVRRSPVNKGLSASANCHLNKIWLFFDQDSSRTFLHALRRHWFTKTSYTQLHFPLTAGLTLLSGSLKVLISREEATRGILWYFSGGIATCLLSIALLGMCHRSLDDHRSGILPRSIRISLRVLAAVFIAVTPLFGLDNVLVHMGLICGVLAILVTLETLGKLGAMRVQLPHETIHAAPGTPMNRKEQR